MYSGNLEIPFDRYAPPSYFNLHTDAITALRRSPNPERSLARGGKRFGSLISAGNCAMAECHLGYLLGACSEFWWWIRIQILPGDSLR